MPRLTDGWGVWIENLAGDPKGRWLLGENSGPWRGARADAVRLSEERSAYWGHRLKYEVREVCRA